MLVFPDGSQRGTLGGGCVEAEVKQRALRVLLTQQDRPEVLTFHLDDDYGWDDGLICGGRMSILAEPLAFSSPALSERRQAALLYFGRLQELVDQGQGCTEAVLLAEAKTGAAVGSRYLFDPLGRLTGQLASGPAPEEVARHLTPVGERPKPSVHHGVAYLPLPPRLTLLLVGAGHVGQAVARLAAEVDFNVWVLDDRPSYASRERFPSAQRLLVGDIGATLKELVQRDITPSTYCLIVTRGHAHDEEALYHLAPTPAGYVGMIGSKRKIKMIYEDLIARGLSEEILAKVHAPLGIPIGSQTVPEIAISILAELIACRNLGASPHHSAPRPVGLASARSTSRNCQC